MRKFFVAWGIAFAILLAVGAVFFAVNFVLQWQNNDQNNMINTNDMRIASPSFENNDGFPPKFTCDGEETNPPLEFANIPRKARSLALVLRDPDAPSGTFIHWILWNIDPATETVKSGELPAGARQGKTTNGKVEYVGPCPPSGTHRYIFTLYALDAKLYLNEGADIEQFEGAISGHVLETAQIMAKYR